MDIRRVPFPIGLVSLRNAAVEEEEGSIWTRRVIGERYETIVKMLESEL